MTKFLFVVLAVAAGVGALAGVRGFSANVSAAMLTDESRTVMAADLTARQFTPASDAQVAAARCAGAARRGSHADHGNGFHGVLQHQAAPGTDAATPVLVSIKAVDPAKYPYYGDVKLNPPMPLTDALTPDAVVVAKTC